MHEELTNLLPIERVARLRRQYIVGVLMVAAALAAALALAAAALMVPELVYLRRAVDAKQARLSALSAPPQSNEGALADQLTVLLNETRSVLALQKAKTASDTIRAVLAISHPGISLIGFKYGLSAAGRTVAVTGVASDRDALRNYQLQLQSSSLVKSADLPVSTYAKDSDIPFTLTLTLTP